MTKLQKLILKLESELATLKSRKTVEQSNQKFLCGCGKYHLIKSCDAIQTIWYSYSDDDWNDGEIQVKCPKSNLINRLLYKSYYDIEYPRRNEFKYNAEQQFNANYLHLFKSLEKKQKDEQDRANYYNNYYIDTNHKKFGINITGKSL